MARGLVEQLTHPEESHRKKKKNPLLGRLPTIMMVVATAQFEDFLPNASLARTQQYSPDE